MFENWKNDLNHEFSFTIAIEVIEVGIYSPIIHLR